MIPVYLLIAVFSALGGWFLTDALVFRNASFRGRKALRQADKWQNRKRDVWDAPILRKLSNLAEKLVFLDRAERERLERTLKRAGFSLTPEVFTARKFVILAFGALGILLCALAKFWLGIPLAVLAAVYGLMRQKEQLTGKLKEKDDEITQDMPRFVRTVCKNLQSNRDIYAALASYRTVANPTLGAELDILLAEMRSGSVSAALQQFASRIGTDAAYRFSSALTEMERGVDQRAALEYLADDMARQARLNIQKTLSTRPAKMRQTYLPAVGVCVVMILYVLVVFVMDQLNTLF